MGSTRKNADYIELQIWYPDDLARHGKDDRGYLYQVTLNNNGTSTAEGLTMTKLLVSAEDRAQALTLAVVE